MERYRIKEDNTYTDDEKTLAHKGIPILEEDHNWPKNRGHISKADFFRSDCRMGKPHYKEQEPQDVTRKLADPIPSFSKLQVLIHEITAEAPVSMHLPTPTIISSMGKNRSKDYSRSNNNAYDDDKRGSGNGSNNQDKNKEPTISSIAEEVLDIFESRTPLSEHEIAVSRLPVLKTTLVLSDMIQPRSSKELIDNYRARRAGLNK